MPRRNGTKDTPRAGRKAARNVSVPRIPLARVNAADKMSITTPLAAAIAAPADVRQCKRGSAVKGAVAMMFALIMRASSATTVSGICVSEMRVLPNMPSRALGSAASIRRRNTAEIAT